MVFSATYFFMVGRLVPVSDLFSTGDAGFRVVMIIYSFIAVILMLNVLIALINVAFTTGDESAEYEANYCQPVTSQFVNASGANFEENLELRNFVAMQLQLRPLKDGAKESGVAVIVGNVAIMAEERSVSEVEADAVVTTINSEPTVGDSVLESSNSQDRTKGNAPGLDPTGRRDALQALASQHHAQALRQQEEARQREETLQKQV
ncbi:hypothetical protein BGZ81_009950 [Podila clonocystis]|nr:hypothetical protein BGZ81_009950 [Podila clonocystis]